MKKLLTILCLLPTILFAQIELPEKVPNTYVFDYEHLLTDSQISSLNSKIQELEKKSSIEVALITYDIGDNPIEDVTLQFARTWGVGKRGLNNGVVYLISPKNHKARIEVGYGLEGTLTDIETSEMQDNVKSFYRNSDWYGGISSIFDQIYNKLGNVTVEQRELYNKQLEAEEAQRKADNEYQQKILTIVGIVIVGIITIIIFFFLIKGYFSRKKAKIEKIKIEKEKERQRIEREKEKEKQRIEREKLEKERIERERVSLISKVMSDFSSYLEKINKYEDKLKMYISNFNSKNYKFPINFSSYKNSMKSYCNDYENFIKNTIVDVNTTYKDIVSIKRNLSIYETNMESVIKSIESEVSSYIRKENYVKSSISNIGDLYKKAKIEIVNTPFKTLRESVYNSIINWTGDLWSIYDKCCELETLYNKILSYREEQEKIKIEARRAAEAKKRREEEEERYREAENRRRREEEESSRNSYSSLSSSWGSDSSSSSSSYDSGSSFGGGDFGGAGSSSSW